MHSVDCLENCNIHLSWITLDHACSPGIYTDSCQIELQYIVENEAHIESEEFPLLSANGLITILQDRENKNKFLCFFDDHKNKFKSKLELTRSEVERLEHTIIESGKARVEGNIQYIPRISGDC